MCLFDFFTTWGLLFPAAVGFDMVRFAPIRPLEPIFCIGASCSFKSGLGAGLMSSFLLGLNAKLCSFAFHWSTESWSTLFFALSKEALALPQVDKLNGFPSTMSRNRVLAALAVLPSKALLILLQLAPSCNHILMSRMSSSGVQLRWPVASSSSVGMPWPVCQVS